MGCYLLQSTWMLSCSQQVSPLGVASRGACGTAAVQTDLPAEESLRLAQEGGFSDCDTLQSHCQ